MITYLAVSGICSAAVLAGSFIGIRPLELAVRIPFAVAISWVLS